VTPGRGFDWRDALFGLRPWITGRARMLSADNIGPLASPLLSADNNLFRRLVESGASMASHSASPISFIDSTQLDIRDYSLLPSPALPLARGATAPHAGFLGPALLTTGRWQPRGQPARRLALPDDAWLWLHLEAWCLPNVSSRSPLTCPTLTLHPVALGGSDIKIRCAHSHQT
jgi:hypothetical protein